MTDASHLPADLPPTPTAPPPAGGHDPASGMPALAARGLVKEYGPTRALAGVDLAVPRGQSLAIMGPSGSGKTTLLHVLAGMILPDAGTVSLQPGTTAEAVVTSLSPDQRTRLRRERFGFVFQQGLLLPELSAEENVAVAAMLAGANRAQATGRAREWLASLGLAEHAHKRIGQLSGGQAQRVAVARAQITEPEVVFADEPTGALDSRTSAEVLRILLDTTVGRGRTLVMVTHDENVAATCARTVRLSDGLIVADTAGGSTRGVAPGATVGGSTPGTAAPGAAAGGAR
ncbi:ABC transporter ATP-binding protein [Brevibacterium yomogidense]